MKKFNIALVSEFCFPDIGGVEYHMLRMAKEYHQLGHKVIIITRAFENRKGVRYIDPGVKVYYIPIKFFNKRVIKSFMIDVFFLLYDILKRENIEIIHSHQLSSFLGININMINAILNLNSFCTLHSLFDLRGVDSNILYKVQMRNRFSYDSFIAVSNIVKENHSLLTSFNHMDIAVIPNGIDTNVFKPKLLENIEYNNDKNPIVKIMVLSRFNHRKGVNFLIEMIPIICKKYKNVQLHIGGSGDYQELLEFIIKKYDSNNIIKFYGQIPHEKVSEFLSQGDIFLNTSLLEAFCMAVLEAVALGLYCVSTNVGGIPEILPNNILYLSDPDSKKLLDQLDILVKIVIDEKLNKSLEEINNRRIKFYNYVKGIYDWEKLAKKTIGLYHYYYNQKKITLKEYISFQWNQSNYSFILLCILTLIIYIYSKIYDLFFFKHKVYDFVQKKNK